MLVKEILSPEEVNKLDEADEKDLDDEEERQKIVKALQKEKSIGQRIF